MATRTRKCTDKRHVGDRATEPDGFFQPWNLSCKACNEERGAREVVLAKKKTVAEYLAGKKADRDKAKAKAIRAAAAAASKKASKATKKAQSA